MIRRPPRSTLFPYTTLFRSGTVTIMNPASMDIPWPRISVNRNHPSMDLADAEFNETPGQQLGVTFNPASAEQLFAGSGHPFAEIAALGKDRKPLPRFPLAVSLKANAVILTKSLESANIVAKLPGSDPALKNEFVVLSAHIDHVGIGAPINGDRIYNGAMDDGSGSALVMDIAANLKAHPENIQRSMLFLLVTAEEKGLLGSKYFAAHPTVPARSIVADVNVDMFLPIVPLKILKIEGIEESDLGARAAAIAQSMGIKPIPDPEPLRNAFIRSDQYSFIKKGVPAVKVDVGFELGTPEQKVFKDWLTNRYHAPSDDVNQPVDLKAAAGYEEFTRRLLLETANTLERPRWKTDSFFRRYATDSGSSPKEAAMGRAVVHFEIGCQNSGKTQEFYEKLFDWKIEAMGPAAMIAAEPGGIAGHITALGHEPNHHTMFYVDVDDVAADLEKAKPLGGKTLVPPVEIPPGNFAWMPDPEGKKGGLWEG